MLVEPTGSAPTGDVRRCPRCGDAVAGSRCSACGAPTELAGATLLRSLAQRPYGTTWLAEAPGVGKCVVKEILLAAVPGREALDSLEREGAMLGSLALPGVPRVLRTAVEGEGAGTRLLLIREWVEGRSVLEELEATGPVSEAAARALARELLGILASLHRRSPPMVHRDIKPANIVRRPDRSLAIVDFGTARELVAGITHGSTLVGTFGYMPPEQLGGSVDPGVDLHALGATLVHLLAGKPPWELLRDDLRLDLSGLPVSRSFRIYLARLTGPRRRRFRSAEEALAGLDRRGGALPWLGGGAAGGLALALAALVAWQLPRSTSPVPASEAAAEALRPTASTSRYAGQSGAGVSAGSGVLESSGVSGGRPSGRMSELEQAASRGEVKAVQAWIAAGGDPGSEEARTALAIALRRGDVASARLLLAAGIPPDAQSSHGSLPEVAAQSNMKGGLDLLLESGLVLTPELRDHLLERAVGSGAGPQVTTLLAHGASPDLRVRPSGVTLLTRAAEQGDAKLIELLAAAGASLDGGGDRLPPLLRAARNHRVPAVRALLAAGALPDARGPGGETPLMAAAEGGDAETVQLLLAARADPTRRDDTGMTALDLAVRREAPEVIRLLRQPPARRGGAR